MQQLAYPKDVLVWCGRPESYSCKGVYRRHRGIYSQTSFILPYSSVLNEITDKVSELDK